MRIAPLGRIAIAGQSHRPGPMFIALPDGEARHVRLKVQLERVEQLVVSQISIRLSRRLPLV